MTDDPRNSGDKLLCEVLLAWDGADRLRDSSYEISKSFCGQLRNTKAHRSYGWAALTFGRISTYRSEFDEAEIYLSDAVGRFCYIKDTYGQVVAESHFALIELSRRNISRALELALRPWNSSIRFRDQDADLLHVITAAAYYESGEAHAALLHLTKAHDSARRNQDSLRQAKISNNIGAVLLDLGEYELALPVFLQSWEVHSTETTHFEDSTYIVPLANIVCCQVDRGRFAEAAPYADLLLDYFRRSDAYVNIHGLHNLCEHYFLSGDRQTALWCLSKIRSYVAAHPAVQLVSMLQVTEAMSLESEGHREQAIAIVRPLMQLPRSEMSSTIMRTAAHVLQRSYTALGKSTEAKKWEKVWAEHGRGMLLSSLLVKQIRASVVTEKSSLTDTELTCLSLSARGQTSADIAQKLGIKTRTVNFHFAKVLRKLNAMNRQEAIAKAVRANLVNI